MKKRLTCSEPCLSVIIPLFNEKDTVSQVIDTVLEQPSVAEVILVDDCSTDGSQNLIDRHLAYIRSTNIRPEVLIRYLRHAENMGKGAAIRSGVAFATAPFVIIQDADLEYDPKEYEILLGPLIAGKADVVFGSRFLGAGAHRVLYFWHYIGNKFLTLLSNMFTNLNLTDMETCYKMFKRELIQSFSICENRFGFEPEVTAKVALLKPRIYEVAISYYGRTYEEGKKISWKDGFSALRCIVKYGLLTKLSKAQ